MTLLAAGIGTLLAHRAQQLNVSVADVVVCWHWMREKTTARGQIGFHDFSHVCSTVFVCCASMTLAGTPQRVREEGVCMCVHIS